MAAEQRTDSGWVQRYIDAWNTRDGAKVVDFVTDDVVFVDNALGERFEGPDAVRQFVDDTSVSLSSDFSFVTGQVLITEDSYAFECNAVKLGADCEDVDLRRFGVELDFVG